MLINEIFRILAQVRFQGYPLFLPNIRPFFCPRIEHAEVAASRKPALLDSPTTNFMAWCGEINLLFGTTEGSLSEQIHPASTSITKSKRRAEVIVAQDESLGPAHGVRWPIWDGIFIKPDSSQKKHSATEKGMDESIPFSTARTTEAILSAGASRSGHAPM